MQKHLIEDAAQHIAVALLLCGNLNSLGDGTTQRTGGTRVGFQNLPAYPDLQDEKFIIMQPSSRSRDKMEELMLIYDRGGFMPNIEAFCEEPETILLMVSVGLGICLMPEYIVRYHRKNQNLVILPVVRQDGRAETLDFEMVWSENCHNLAVEKMLNCCKTKA